jgi:hypothetical protein
LENIPAFYFDDVDNVNGLNSTFNGVTRAEKARPFQPESSATPSRKSARFSTNSSFLGDVFGERFSFDDELLAGTLEMSWLC